MPRPDVQPLRELLYRALVRYLTVRPRGFEIDAGKPLRTSVEARILGFGGARTLYVDRRPNCRSLDGVRPMNREPSRTCAECIDRARCVPQIRLDLIVEERPFRMLLAHSSARAFLHYEADLRRRDRHIEDVVTKITVLNRGSWGELLFAARD